MSITPSLALAAYNKNAYVSAYNKNAFVKAIDSTFYVNKQSLSSSSQWSSLGTQNIISINVDPFDNSFIAIVNADGSIYYNWNLAGWAKMALPTGEPGALSIAISKQMIYIVTTTNKLYFSTVICGKITASTWTLTKKPMSMVFLKAGFSQVLNSYKGSNWFITLGTDGNVYATPDGWLNPSCEWVQIYSQKDAVKIAWDNKFNVWILQKSGSVVFAPYISKTGNTFTNINLPNNLGIVNLTVNDTGSIAIISTDGWYYFASDVISGTSIVWIKSGLSEINKIIDNPINRITNNQVSITTINNYCVNNSYTSLKSPLSNPKAGTTGDSFINNLVSNGITDFFPFKILTLFDLINMGKAHIVANEGSGISGTPSFIYLFNMTFLPTDSYLPVSDVILVGDVDYNTVFCLLVFNNPKYSTLISDTTFVNTLSNVGRQDGFFGFDALGTFQRFDHNVNWNIYSSVSDPTRTLSNNCIIGDIVKNGNCTNLTRSNIVVGSQSSYGDNTVSETNINPVISILPLGNKVTVRTFAAINKNYLYLPNDITKKQLCILNGNTFYKSSAFNTFIFKNNYNYFDILPEYLLAAICGNNLTLSKLGLPVTLTPASGINPINCSTFMSNYGSKNNYSNILDEKYINPYSEWCAAATGTNSCDSNLLNFCQLGPSGTPYVTPPNIPRNSSPSDLLGIYPNSNNKLCGCFLPKEYYEANDYYKIASATNNDKDALDGITEAINQGAYNLPECTGKCSNSTVFTQKWKSAPGGCKNVQICKNKFDFVNLGTMTGSTFNVNQTNKCSQENAPSTDNKTKSVSPTIIAGTQDPVKEPSKIIKPENIKAKVPVQSSNTTIIIVIAIIIMLLLGGGAFFLFK